MSLELKPLKCNLHLHMKQLRHFIIQYLSAQNIRANGINDFCYNLKRTKNTLIRTTI